MLDSARGPRVLVLAGSVLLAASIGLLTFVQEVWQFYVLFGLLGSLALVGSPQQVGEVVLAKWFVRQRGRAMALSSMSTPLSGMFMPVLLQILISSFGWRDAWLILGVAALVLMVPLSLLIRATPEEMGLRPDGDPERPQPVGGTSSVRVVHQDERSMTRSEAVRTRSFWMLLLAMTLFSMHGQGFQQNWMPYFQDQGFSVATGTAAIAFYGIFSTLARIFWGLMAERVYITTLMAAGTSVTAATILILLNAETAFVLFLYVALQGLTLGGQFMLQPLAVANVFGRAHLGAIRGVMRPALTFSSAAGPLIIAAMYDAQGSYKWAFAFVMFSWFGAGACYYLASRLRQPLRSAAPLPAAGEA
jgi:sugar phosphate permease